MTWCGTSDHKWIPAPLPRPIQSKSGDNPELRWLGPHGNAEKDAACMQRWKKGMKRHLRPYWDGRSPKVGNQTGKCQWEKWPYLPCNASIVAFRKLPTKCGDRREWLPLCCPFQNCITLNMTSHKWAMKRHIAVCGNHCNAWFGLNEALRWHQLRS